MYLAYLVCLCVLKESGRKVLVVYLMRYSAGTMISDGAVNISQL